MNQASKRHRFSECIFCGSKAKLTKEHIWPKWLRGSIRGGDTAHRIVIERLGQRRKTVVHEKAASITVKAVCKACNDGWMSDLEQEAMRVVEPLVSGALRPETPQITIAAADRQVLASWIFKTAVCMWAYDRGDVTELPPDLDHPRLHAQPPPTCCVWIGAYVEEDHLGGAYDAWIDEFNGAQLDDDPIPPGYHAALGAGRLVAVVAGHAWSPTRVQPVLSDAPGPIGPLRDALVAVWPSDGHDIHWPPANRYTNRALADLGSQLPLAFELRSSPNRIPADGASN
jgi:hypothetical protein